MSIVPAYISRSVAGSYDNEGIAIFCMLITYYLWIKSVKTGSMFWASITALAYFYMVSSWGGYVFLINLIPLHVLALMIMQKFDSKIYIAYTTFYSIGTLLSMQIAFVGDLPSFTSEHMGALGVFGLCQIVNFIKYLNGTFSRKNVLYLFKISIAIFSVLCIVLISYLMATHRIAPWVGRFYSFIDPSYARNNIPIIASVSEHQPTAWASFFFDLQFMLFAFPAGIFIYFKKLNKLNVFLIIYAVTTIYFTGVMIRLMLVLAPIMCIVSSASISGVLSNFSKFSSKKESPSYFHQIKMNLLVSSTVGFLLIYYSFHCIWIASVAYSNPSIILSAKMPDSSLYIIDDYREAYNWLKHNTPEDSKVLAWWDYGYQITQMANRTVLVDNNTWNNTQIALVGQVFALPEKKAYKILSKMDVNYILVVFGGSIGYGSDDINKFYWIVKIAGSIPEGKNLHEHDYFGNGLRIDKHASKAMKESVIYKTSYHRFTQKNTVKDQPPGFDRVRNQVAQDVKLELLEEAYTTKHWIIRIFKVKKDES
ncbi:hypothetical protein A3Q56_04094 [Intoshia linei]|uniref:Dolichyl-diphosphooligosaccharide--protein glycosyltransferase subunit STT3A n=1 Tax=Intoshia linei TaxID=1819745 RepID=A0A177B1Z7_9BILA|nr:hypothetical protein A3Q56_04094 [Intoshia linei]